MRVREGQIQWASSNEDIYGVEEKLRDSTSISAFALA